MSKETQVLEWTEEGAISAAKETNVAADEFKPHVDRVYAASRPSRGKSDSVPAGLVSRISGRIGIVDAEGTKYKDDDDRWNLEWRVRPPKDASEVAKINRAMLRRWHDRAASSLGVGPDDDRMLAEYDSQQENRRKAIAGVKGLLGL